MSLLIVGLDFSAPSRKALDAAVALAKQMNGSLLLVAALTPLPPGSKEGHLDPLTRVRLESEQTQSKAEAASWAKQVARQVPVEHVERLGKAADVLIAEARQRKASYIVVGTHGRTGIKRAVLGSVAEAVVRASPVPVLVVPS